MLKKNVKMSANRISVFKPEPYFAIYCTIFDRITPKNCNTNIFPGNNLGFKIPSKYTFKNSRGFCELWAHTPGTG